MQYLREITGNWRPLLAASLGLAAGTISTYVNNLFSPSLIAEFGWAKSDFALIGLTVAFAAICLPIAGRIADRVGTRRIAMVGVAGLPLVFAGLATMNGGFGLFFMLSTLQMLIVSSLAGAVVYTRLIAQKFSMARGVALGIASCAPPAATALLSPLLSMVIADLGWRMGYVGLGIYSAVFGAIALWLIPADTDGHRKAATGLRLGRQGYMAILRDPAFLLIFGALLLCNLHFTIQTTQLKVILMDRGLGADIGSLMVSVFATGVVIGRIACGLALDRFPTHLVAVVSFAIPAVGLGILASEAPGLAMVTAAIMCLGLSLGAEGDLAVYLAAKYFRQDIFSSVLGLFTGAMAVSATIGAGILSLLLMQFASYTPFLIFTATSMMLGALSFLLLPRLAARRAGGADASGVANGETVAI